MDSKSLRLTEIKKIIQNEHVTSQDELLKSLISSGFHLTQATLSRDLKLLKVAKMPDNRGAYRYVLPDSINAASTQIKRKTSLDGLLSIEFSGNLAVIRTLPAFSPTVASAIDGANITGIMGTLAGDDTIILALRDGVSVQQIKNSLVKNFPDFIDKLL